MPSRFLPLLLGAGLLLTACTGGSDQPAEVALPSPAVSCAPDAQELPAECVGDPSDFDAVPTPSGSAPSNAADIPAVTLPAAPGDLARGGNDKDPALTTQTLTVTVPAGSRLTTTAACQGGGSIKVVAVPESAAAQEFACGVDAVAELTVEDGVPVSAPTQFRVTVTTTAASRWAVAVGATSEPAPPAAQ